MEKERTRGRTRRKQPSRIVNLLYHEGRRWCAVALSVCMVLSNMTGTAFAAEAKNEDDYLFKMTRSSLYDALQEAVVEKNIVDEEFLFQGSDEESKKAYEKLLEMNDDLYELKPEIKNTNRDLKLRVFASLDWGTEEGQEYRVMGSEKFIFLFTNKSETEQQAVIQMDELQSEVITVAPKTELAVAEDEEETKENREETSDAEEDNLGGNHAGESGGGSSGGGNGTSGNHEEKNDEQTSEITGKPDTDREDETGESIEETVDSGAVDEIKPADDEDKENKGQDEENKQVDDSEQANDSSSGSKDPVENENPAEDREEDDREEVNDGKADSESSEDHRKPEENKESSESKEPSENKETNEDKGQAESNNKNEGNNQKEESKESGDKSQGEEKAKEENKSSADAGGDKTESNSDHKAEGSQSSGSEEKSGNAENDSSKDHGKTENSSSKEEASGEKTDVSINVSRNTIRLVAVAQTELRETELEEEKEVEQETAIEIEVEQETKVEEEKEIEQETKSEQEETDFEEEVTQQDTEKAELNTSEEAETEKEELKASEEAETEKEELNASEEAETEKEELNASEEAETENAELNASEEAETENAELNVSEEAETEKAEQEASPSEAEETVLEGTIYNSILMNEEAVNIFVTTAKDLGLDKDEFKSLQIYETEIEGFTVRVGADTGVLPEDAELRVTELKEEEEEHAEQYKEAKEALDKEEIEYDGMMALDISFFDRDGNEIEPDGEVRVSIKMAPERIPEEVIPESISVQHLEEKKNGEVQAVQVADVEEKTEGKVEVNEEEAIAEFSVESFSTFTITWKYDNDRQNDYTVNLKFVDESEIDLETNSLIKISNMTLNEEIELSSYKDKVKDSTLTYMRAYYKDSKGNKHEVDSIYPTQSSDKYYLILKNDNNEIADLGKNNVFKEITIFLEYRLSSSTNPPVTTEKELKRSKKATKNTDGTYDLSLSISGAIGSSKGKIPMDFLFIVDCSDSMKNNKRLDNVKAAINNLITTVDKKEKKDIIDAQYSVVSFKSSSGSIFNPVYADYTAVNCDWTKRVSTVTSAVSGLTVSGGTNYQSGIAKGKEQLNSDKKRSNAQTIVVFLTDGVPTFYGIGSNYGDGREYDSEALKKAKIEIQGMSCTSFYAIGVGDKFTDVKSDEYKCLNELRKEVGKRVMGGAPEDKNNVILPVNDSRINEAFTNIIAKETKYLCENVTVTDTLSDKVHVVMNGDNPKKLYVVVRDDQNNIVKEGETSVKLDATEENDKQAVITASYNKNDRTIKLDFPDEYKLEEDWTYTVTIQIDATEEAYEEYRNTGYPDKAEEDTGEHSKQNGEKWELEPGFRSNAEAIVTYTYNNEEKTEGFKHPVVQLNPGKLIIQKKITGLTNEEISTLKQSLAFDVELTWNGTDEFGKAIPEQKSNTKQYSLDDFRLEGDTFILEIDRLSPNTRYVVTETNKILTGYNCETTVKNYLVNGQNLNNVNAEKLDSVNGTIQKGETWTAEFTNEYTSSGVSILVKKILKDWNSSMTKSKVEDVTFKLVKSDDNWQTTDVIINDWAVVADGEVNQRMGLTNEQNLTVGKYLLYETETAIGYQLPNLQESMMKISVELENGSIVVYDCTVDGKKNKLTPEKNGLYQIEVKNERIYTPVLPDTGGPGLAMFERCGWFLLLMALLMAGVEVHYYGERKYKRAMLIQQEEHERLL